MIALMAKQHTVQIGKIVPIKWLQDYVAMLRWVREQKDDTTDTRAVDARIDRRIRDVQAYLDRLERAQLN